MGGGENSLIVLFICEGHVPQWILNLNSVLAVARNIIFKLLYAMVEAHDSPQSVHITFVQTALECNSVRFILKLRWLALSKRTVKIITFLWGECLTHFQFGWLFFSECSIWNVSKQCILCFYFQLALQISCAPETKYTYHSRTMTLTICSYSNQRGLIYIQNERDSLTVIWH